MIISGKSFNENETLSFIYKKNDTFSAKVKVLIARITHFLTTFDWINSEKIFNAVHTNETLTLKIFKDADLSVSLNKKIYDISQRILRREERIDLLKRIAKPSSYYEFPVFKNNSLLEWIHLIHKTDLSDNEKRKFDDLPIDFGIRISILNKIALLYHATIPTTLTPENFTDEAFLKCLNDATKDLEKAYQLLTREDLTNLIKTIPFNDIPLLVSLQKNWEERIKQWIDRPLLKKKESLLLKINQLLDEKVKEKRKIVETSIDFEQFRASYRSRLGQIIAYFKKATLSLEEREAILNYQIPNFEAEVQAYAETYGCKPPPPFSEEEAQKRIQQLRQLLPQIDYASLLPPGIKPDQFTRRLNYFSLSERVHKNPLTKRERYELLNLDLGYLGYLKKMRRAIDRALNLTKMLYQRGMYNIDPSKLAEAINESDEAVSNYTEQVKNSYVVSDYTKQVKNNYILDEHPIDEIYLSGSFGSLIINGDYDFCKFVKETVDINDLKNLKAQQPRWQNLTDEEKEIGDLLIFVFDNMGDPNNSCLDKVHDLRKNKYPILNANIWAFAKKHCNAKKTRISL